MHPSSVCVFSVNLLTPLLTTYGNSAILAASFIAQRVDSKMKLKKVLAMLRGIPFINDYQYYTENVSTARFICFSRLFEVSRV